MNSNKDTIEGFREVVGDRGPLSDSNSLSRRMIYFHLLKYRSKLIHEKKRQRNYSLSLFNYQKIDCLELIDVPIEQCPCTPLSGCTFKRTKYPVPTIIGRPKSVMSVQGIINYDFIEWERIADTKKARLKEERIGPYYFFLEHDNETYIYVYNDEHKKSITLRAIFENPLDVLKIPDCEGNINQCIDPLEQTFYLDPDLVNIMYELAFTRLSQFLTYNTDIIQNQNDDITNNQSQQ